MNLLKVTEQRAIQALASRGWSQRRIARELGLHRETVGRYVREAAKPAISTAGSTRGRRIQCEQYREMIETGLQAGLSAQRIFQDLSAEHGFNAAMRR